MKCLWCNFETTSNKNLAASKLKFANKEHIFPEAVGGGKTLEIGKVCQDCNKRLGDTVDKFLKTENFMMLKQYQDSSEILGKPIGKIRSKDDRERKVAEQTKLIGYSGGFKIERDKQNSNIIHLTNSVDGTEGDFSYNSKFSKALHKCAINVLYEEEGYDYLKENYSDLINFVNNPEKNSYNDWSYAVCYSDIFSKVHFEPFCMQRTKINNIVQCVTLIFPCAVFIVGTKPNLIDSNMLSIAGSNPPKLKNWEESNFDYLSHFKSHLNNSRKTFGSTLQFTMIKKHINGKPNPVNSFYLLSKCNICNQTNPTGIYLDKEVILGKVSGLTTSGNNGWNYHSEKDLEIICPNTKFADSIINDFITNASINYPPENDVKKLNIKNCKYHCINCRELNIFDAIDCFI